MEWGCGRPSPRPRNVFPTRCTKPAVDTAAVGRERTVTMAAEGECNMTELYSCMRKTPPAATSYCGNTSRGGGRASAVNATDDKHGAHEAGTITPRPPGGTTDGANNRTVTPAARSALYGHYCTNCPPLDAPRVTEWNRSSRGRTRRNIVYALQARVPCTTTAAHKRVRTT